MSRQHSRYMLDRETRDLARDAAQEVLDLTGPLPEYRALLTSVLLELDVAEVRALMNPQQVQVDRQVHRAGDETVPLLLTAREASTVNALCGQPVLRRPVAVSRQR